jgi:hypothetical protein
VADVGSYLASATRVFRIAPITSISVRPNRQANIGFGNSSKPELGSRGRSSHWCCRNSAPIRARRMQAVQTQRYLKKFAVIANTMHVQAAIMTLRGGSASDDEPSNEHAKCEQWLFVISELGTATVIPKRGQRRTVKLLPGTG